MSDLNEIINNLSNQELKEKLTDEFINALPSKFIARAELDKAGKK